MEFKAFFFKLNEDFSPEYAEANNDGKPSENNRLYEWEDELILKNDIKSVEVLEGETYILKGEINGESFEEEVKDMLLFNILGEDNSTTQMACSNVLIDKYELIEDNQIELRVFFKGDEPLSNPVPGVYIALQDFPKRLID
ncbi:MAG: hypothetical protein COA32_06510 [Fluviicola sp.]|nr:MAG: hypothetical protein COA32_06510 [Fluviicola sp.]